jgi:alpha-ketoglutaric semialdehyde dehydrogenase
MTDTITGHSIVAGRSVPGTSGEKFAVDPSTGQTLEPAFSMLSTQQVTEAVDAAEAAFPSFSTLPPARHADFLDTAARNIEALGRTVIQRAMTETGLPEARLTGELARTVNQLRLFADVVRQGDFRGARIDPAQPDRAPAPRVDIRQRQVPLGPVAVFGASNFPLAFSTAGGDTASALAAGCPVVFKAHNAHPGTAELVGHAVAEAVAEHDLHPGVFSLVYGPGASIGQALVQDARIQAVGFTGSRSGGLALVDTAQKRPVPIPVYAEMSSTNPVFILPGSLNQDPTALAEAYIGSVTGSSGQLCTQPGLAFVPNGTAGDEFVAAAARAVEAQSGQTMLTPGIRSAFDDGIERLEDRSGVAPVGSGGVGSGENAPAPRVFTTSVEAFVADSTLQDEIFGAASLVIRYSHVADLVTLAIALEGQLTATLHLDTADRGDLAVAAELLPVLERKAGRILANGWPTGVEVGHAMVHGGPFPATSDSRTTSVGTLAIERFLRPVSYQNLPDELLPAALQAANPWNLNRRVDGSLVLSGENS